MAVYTEKHGTVLFDNHGEFTAANCAMEKKCCVGLYAFGCKSKSNGRLWSLNRGMLGESQNPKQLEIRSIKVKVGIRSKKYEKAEKIEEEYGHSNKQRKSSQERAQYRLFDISHKDALAHEEQRGPRPS
ncbi:hypothetical protein GWK47_044646 [Chionoecetes opilio]|uniref:Uncharacterized protein n=1 Tax=Chionoecetes opilio TaxID=41210 RepID=A0A8J4Y834_CHIOP|nr:hypothetical protein GWK47_044646 [Chionoecetes opilio]